MQIPSYRQGRDPAYFRPEGDKVLRLCLVIGQSWAQGGNPNVLDAPVTPAPLDEASFMLDSGAWPNGDAASHFVPLREQRKQFSIETICSRASHAIVERLRGAGLPPPQFLWISSSLAGHSYHELKRGTAAYQRMLGHVSQAITIAQKDQVQLILENLIIIHGEADHGEGTSRFEYFRYLANWVADVTEDLCGQTAQTTRPHVFITQTCRGSGIAGVSPRIQLAQLDLMLSQPSSVTLVGPSYQFPADNEPAPAPMGVGGHLSASGYGMLGELVGHAIAEQCYGQGFLPLMPVEPHTANWVFGKNPPWIEIEMNQPIEIDMTGETIALEDLPNFGFDFVDGSDNPPEIISVEVVGAPAPKLAILVVGNTIQFSGIIEPTEKVAIRCSGVNYSFAVEPGDSIRSLVARAAALLARDSKVVQSNNSITIPGALGLKAQVLSLGRWLRIRLSGEVRGNRPRLLYACRTTGAGWAGNKYGARGAIRAAIPFGRSDISGKPLHNWMCVDCFELPPIGYGPDS